MDAEDAHAVYRNISTPEEEKTMVRQSCGAHITIWVDGLMLN